MFFNKKSTVIDVLKVKENARKGFPLTKGVPDESYNWLCEVIRQQSPNTKLKRKEKPRKSSKDRVHQVTIFGEQQNVQLSQSCLKGAYWSVILAGKIEKGKFATVKYGIPYTFHGEKLIFGKTKRAIKAIKNEKYYRPVEVEAVAEWMLIIMGM